MFRLSGLVHGWFAAGRRIATIFLRGSATAKVPDWSAILFLPFGAWALFELRHRQSAVK
jgi:hypothetical protein